MCKYEQNDESFIIVWYIATLCNNKENGHSNRSERSEPKIEAKGLELAS